MKSDCICGRERVMEQTQEDKAPVLLWPFSVLKPLPQALNRTPTALVPVPMRDYTIVDAAGTPLHEPVQLHQLYECRALWHERFFGEQQ